MIRTLLKFHNLDSTLDLNDQLSHLFKRGIVMGGDVLTVPSQLAVQVTPFKLIGYDGMVVIETSDTVTLAVPAGQTSVVVYKSIYSPNNDPTLGFEVLELSAYNADVNKNYLTVFATITLGPSATQVLTSDINYNSRDVIDPVGRQNVRGVLPNIPALPTTNNRAGDTWFVTSGLGDTPSINVWNGVTWINTTDSLLVASLLAAHRSNLFSNEIHLTDQQAIAATGTAGTPGVEPIAVTINIVTSTFTLSKPLSNNDMTLTEPVTFLTTGTLPAPLSPSTTYYVIPQAGPAGTTFKVATTPSNATANLPIILGGSQTGTHQAVWEENKYVTSTDSRLPLQSGSDALVGYPANPIPSSSNPFVTASYEVGQPTSKSISSTAGPIAMLVGDGPFYVGVGGAGTAAQYFKIYHASLQREYVDPTSNISVQVSGVFKDVGLTQPLVPSSEPTVVSDFGFWTGPLYLAISGAISANGRVLYGQKQLLNTIDRGFALRPGPFTAETTQEVLQKFFNVSGRKFDDPTLTPEQNINLLIALQALSRYVITTTAANLVVSNSEFARLRSYPQFATEYALQTNETQIVAGNQTFTVSILASDVTAFDALITSPDTPYVAVITYSAPPAGLSSTLPGYIFTDGSGQRFRIINYNPANNNKVLIYCGTRTVSTSTSTTSGLIVAGNNPRQLEITNDHQTNFGEDFIEINGLADMPNEYEDLPPGGSSVGSGSLFTLIGTNILPNQGSGAGTNGRLVWKVSPKIQNNRYDERVRLYGGWLQDTTDFPNQIIGDVSRGILGISFTGRLQDLALYTEFRSGAPFNYRIFVDGVYQSQLYASNLNEPGITDSIINQTNYTNYLVNRPKMQKVALGLSLSTSTIHTVDVEITSAGTIPFALSGIGVLYGTDYQVEAGRTFIGATYNVNVAQDNLSPITTPNQQTVKTVNYISESTTLPAVATQSQPYYADGNWVRGNSATVTISGISDVLFPSVVGDVWYLSTRTTPNADAGSDGYLRVISQNAGSRTLESAPAFTPSYAELAYRIPVSPATGAPVVGAPRSLSNQELNRMLLSDWTVGTENDVGNLESLAQDTRTTVLQDGSTALRMVNCTNQNTNIESYEEALQLSQTSSVVQTTAFCTRMDVVFCGNLGAATITVTIDGAYSYNLTLAGNGVERHTLFYDASLQSHSVLISAPTVANNVCIGEWIFHELVDPAFTGVALSEYNLLKNANPKLFPTFAPIASSAISYNGVRLIDALSTDVRWYGAVTVNAADNNNPYFRTSVLWPHLSTAGAGFTFEFFGSGFEIYMNGTGTVPTPDTVPVSINGLNLTAANFPTANIINSNAGGGFKITTTGNQKLVCTNLSPGFYKIVVTNNLVSGNCRDKTFYSIGLLQTAGQVMLQNLDTTVQNDVHFSQYKDRRSFLSLFPEQIGLINAEGGGGGTTAVGTTVQTLAPQPSYQAVVQDTFDVANTAPTSKVDPTYTKATLNFGLELYNLSLGTSSINATGSTSNVTLNAGLSIPGGGSYAVQPGDIVYFVVDKTWRRIQTVTDQTHYIVDTPYTSAGGAVQVSQAVWTKDLVSQGYVSGGDPISLRDNFPATSIPNVVIDYKDNQLAADSNPNLIGTPNMVCSISNSGLQTDTGVPWLSSYIPLSTTYSNTYTRPAFPGNIPAYPLLANTNQQRLFAVFFPNPAVLFTQTPNLMEYTVSVYQLPTFINAGITNSAFCYNDGSTTEINCLAPALVSGVGSNTRITLNFSYHMNAYPGLVESDIEVLINGQVIPESVAGAIGTGDLAFIEETSNTVLINQDIITGKPLTSIHIRRKRGVQDVSSANTAHLASLSEIWVGSVPDVAQGFANFSSLQSAVSAATLGQTIKIRGNLTITENVTLTQRVNIEGNGYDSLIIGTVTLASGTLYAYLRGFRATQFILNSGANGNIIGACFWTTAPSDSGIGNAISGVTI